jgi:uncharacterized RDD family membrane protein YckC
MGARGLIMTTCIGTLGIAVIATIFVFAGTQWKGGNEGVPIVFFAMSVVCLFGFLVYRSKSKMAKWGARLAASSEEGITVDDGLELFKRYSPFLLAAAAVFIVGGLAGLLRY